MNLNNVASRLRDQVLTHGGLTVETRKQKLRKLSNCIQQNETSINEALRLDLGKSLFETYATEVGFILSEIQHVLKHLDKWARPKKVRTPLTLMPGQSFIHPEPYGVVLILSPWNYPFQLTISPMIGAIAAGNRVIIKPSEMAPATSKVIAKLVSEIFTEDEALVIEGGVTETQVLLKQNFDYIFFTGSTEVGRIVMRAAAEHLTPLTLELGGKSPCIIDETIDVDLAAKRCAWGKFLNAGQTCVAPDFVLVPRKVQASFVERISYHLTKFYGENPKSSKDYARVVNEKHFDRLMGLIDTSKIAFGGEHDRDSRYISPTILKDVSWDDKIMKDEIFGPLLPIIPYDSFEETMTKLKSLPKPLAFYMFSENEVLKKKAINGLSFGGGCINDTVVHLANPNLPFGGIGTSGMGSYHGLKSFETFTHYKSVFHQRTGVDIPLRYPPYEGKLGWLKFFVR